VPSGGSVSVGYQATNCNGYDTTLGSMSATDNSHVGNAAAYPSIQICASAAGTPDPAISGMYTCAAGSGRDNTCGFQAAPEYSVADTYGLIQLNGTNFGSTAGTVKFTGNFGTITGTVHATAEGACLVGGWAADGTSVCVEVSSAIANSVYDGTVTLIRQGDLKQATINLHIQPRITSNNPTSGAPGDPTEINGDHFCQPSGTCPNQSLLPDADHIAFFGSTQALASDFVTSCSGGQKWSNTQVCVKIPAGATGYTKIQGDLSPLYESQRQAFTVQSVTPATPSNLKQSHNSGFTNLISTGGYASSTPVYFAFDTNDGVSGGMIYPQFEIRPVSGPNKDFGSTCPAAYCKEGSGSAYTNGTVTLNISTSSPDDLYHWRVRAHYIKNSIDYYSAWQSYGGNPETSADLIVDTIPPVITFTPTDTCAGGQSGLGANGVTISWSLNESGSGQLIYSKNSDLSSGINFPATPQAYNSTHSVSLTNLDSGTTYYYKVKSLDSAHNIGQRPVSSPYCSFITTSVNAPAKTTKFFAMSLSSVVAGGSIASTSFSVYMPESGPPSPTVVSAFMEVTGVYDTTGSSPNRIGIRVNSQAVKYYVMPAVSSKSNFKIIYPVSSVNINPVLNVFYIEPETNINVYGVSAEADVTYSYTP
jgi:hypothetical protein